MFYFEKQPREVINGLGIDFTNWLDEGETINSFSVAASADNFVSSPVKDGNKILCTISGGSDGDEVKVTYTITTSNGSTYESEILVKIKEK